MSREPSPYELWRQAGGDGARYRELLREHGHLIPLGAGEKPEPLPCGWPSRRVADDPTPTTGAPYDDYERPAGCICYVREDPDWGEVYTRPEGRACPAHDCSCDIGLRCRAHLPTPTTNAGEAP